MKNYLVLVRGGDPGFDKLGESEREAYYGSWMNYVKSLNESGHWVKGNPLDDSGRLYCDQREAMEGVVGEPDVSIGGFLLLQAESYEKTVELCEACPTLTIGGKLEIRECLEM